MSKARRLVITCVTIVSLGVGASLLKQIDEREGGRGRAATEPATMNDGSNFEDDESDLVDYVAAERIDAGAILVEEVRDGGAIIRISQSNSVRTYSRGETRAVLEDTAQEVTQHGIVLVPISKIDLPDSISGDVERLCTRRCINLFVKEPLGRHMPLGQKLVWLVKSGETSGGQEGQPEESGLNGS